jgi:YVTN family beta-propeller protein
MDRGDLPQARSRRKVRGLMRRRWLAFLAPLIAIALLAIVPSTKPCSVSAQQSRVVRTARGGPRRLRVVGRVPAGIQPKSVAVSPDGRRVFVATFGRPDRDNVRVYDSETLAHVGTIEFEGNAVEIAFSPDGRTIYVSNFRRHTIQVVDAETLRQRGEVRVGHHPKVIVVSPDGHRIYTANWAGSRITEIDADTLTVTRSMHTGEHPRGMAVTPDGQRLFAAAMYSHIIHVFDRGASNERTQFRPCEYPRHLSIHGARLYVSCSCCRQVRWFNTETYELEGIAQTGENPRSIDLSTDGRWLAAADFDDSTVALIDTVENVHRVHPIPEANQIVGVAIRPGDGPLRIFATSWGTAELIALEPAP